MCRNIQTLHNFEPPASQEEIRLAALQYVRKISGTRQPSRANAAAFDAAVETVASATGALLASLTTDSPPRDRQVEAARRRAASERRFPRS
jgi:hypothetical protein